MTPPWRQGSRNESGGENAPHCRQAEENTVRATEPDLSSPVEQASPPQQSPVSTKVASSAPSWRLAGLAALIVVLVIAAFASIILSRNGSPLGGRLTGTGPSMSHAAPSVYMMVGHTLYAITTANGTLRLQIRADSTYSPDPVVAKSIVYTSEIPNGFVMARRASDGAVLWRKLVIQAEGKRLALAGDTLYMTTDMLGGEVLFPGYAHGVYALRASDGTIRWHYDTTDPVLSPPLVVDGVVYAGAGTSLVALRASDGTLLWQRPLAVGGHPYLPLWLTSSAGTLYTYGREQNTAQPYTPTFSGDATVFAVQAGDGAVRWSRTLDGTEPDQEPSMPVIADGIVYVRSNGLGSQALARGVPSFGFGLHALRASDGSPLWTYPTAFTQPAAANGVVYTGDTSGNVIALHASDGALIWKQLVAGPTREFWRMSSLTIANDTLYVASGVTSPAGDVAVKALRASDGQQRWARPLPGSSAIQFGTPVFVA